MPEIFKAPKGVPDYVPAESAVFLAVREALIAPIVNAHYDYIELPVYEDTALFERGVGQSTDVVQKEMFTFEDRGGRSITLRPEGTAGVIRAVIEHNLHKGQLPLKLWYAGAFFRAERPQAGRYRQLQQVGIEAIGSDDPALDAEVIAIADDGFRNVGLTGFELQMNSLGCRDCRLQYREQLTAFLVNVTMDEETRNRALLNPLRVLDDKREEIQKQLQNAPLQVDTLCISCLEHYSEVKSILQVLGISYNENPRMVRGLDYYTKTTFEFIHPLLGAQSGIGGGGRYDGLMSELGGEDLSGIGFGLGVDRTLLALRLEGKTLEVPNCDAYVIALGDDARLHGLKIVRQLRSSGYIADFAFGNRSLKGAMKAADKLNAKFVIVIGNEEIQSNRVNVKNMETGESQSVSTTELQNFIQQSGGE
ncbi:MAG: histidine--tRNA ligase [Candidatus Nanopelagicales bacterium]